MILFNCANVLQDVCLLLRTLPVTNVLLRFTTSLVYYGLTMSAADFTTDLYVGIVLTGAVEIPAVLICIFLMNLKW